MQTDLAFLNTYGESGIGDFGAQLADQMGKRTLIRCLLRTGDTWSSFLRSIGLIITWRGTLVANLGLTSWGRSPVRNCLGITAVALRARFGRTTVVLIHNLIEAIDIHDSGYAIGDFARRVAHFATSILRHCKTVVFSEDLSDTLARRYGWSASLTAVIPCNEPRCQPDESRESIVVTPGYASPYKGLSRLPEIRKRLDLPGVQFFVIGGKHKLLQGTESYSKQQRETERILFSEGITTIGYLPENEFDAWQRKAGVALLPYTSTQGASATFSRLASNCLPTVTTDRREFRRLARLGAGLVIASDDPRELARDVRRILQTPRLARELSEKQAAFARAHGWDAFIDSLTALVADANCGTLENDVGRLR